MSLAALPSELDLAILEHLYHAGHKSALIAISYASKYYRKTAAPLIHRNIVISDCIEFRVKSLLMTLLDRRDLAQHIESFKVPPGFQTPCMLHLLHGTCHPQDFDKYADTVKDTINSMQLSGVFSFDRFHKMFVQAGSFVQSRPSIDGALALIFVLATNIHTIQVGVSVEHPLEITSEILAFPWPPAHTTSTPFPLSKLTDLHVNGIRYGGTTLPTNLMKSPTQSLNIRNCRITAIPCPSYPVLRQLQLCNVGISPALMETLVSSPFFQNLRKLSLRSLLNLRDGWYTYDFPRLIDDLAKNVPHLEALEVYDIWIGSWKPCYPFRSFKPLYRLHTLRIDIDLLMQEDLLLEDNTSNDSAMFPSSLRHLELTQIFTTSLDFSSQRQFSDTLTFFSEIHRTVSTYPAPKTKLASFTLELTMYFSTPDTHAELKFVAGECAKRGLKYRVKKFTLFHDGKRKYLISPESVAPLRHGGHTKESKLNDSFHPRRRWNKEWMNCGVLPGHSRQS